MLQDIVLRIKAFVDDRDWDQFHTPRNLATSLSLEASEVLEIFLWKLDNDLTPDDLDSLRDELADVLICLLMLSTKLDIDLLDATHTKIDKNIEKYPVAKSKGRAVKYTEL